MFNDIGLYLRGILDALSLQKEKVINFRSSSTCLGVLGEGQVEKDMLR
jgi:hypothetical protein